MATAGLRAEGPTATRKLPQPKAFFLQGPKYPSSSINASGQGIQAFSSSPASQLASAVPDFPPQILLLPHLPRHPHVLCIPHIPPGTSSSCLNLLPTTIPAPRTHPCAPHPLPHQGRVSVLTLHFSGHLQICKQAGYVVSSFADLQVSA